MPIIEESQRLVIAVGTLPFLCCLCLILLSERFSLSELVPCSSLMLTNACLVRSGTGLAQAGRKVTIRDYKDTVNEVCSLTPAIAQACFAVSMCSVCLKLAWLPTHRLVLFSILQVRKEFGKLFHYEVLADSDSNAEKTESRAAFKVRFPAFLVVLRVSRCVAMFLTCVCDCRRRSTRRTTKLSRLEKNFTS